MFLSTKFSETCRIKRLMFIAGICVFLTGCKGKEMVQPEETSNVQDFDVMEADEEESKREAEEDAGTSAWEDADKSAMVEDDIEIPLLEQLFSYEKSSYYGEEYLIITGVAEEYRKGFWQYMAQITGRREEARYMKIPADMNGVPVKVIGEMAFAEMDVEWLALPDMVEVIEDKAFQNTQIEELELPADLQAIGKSAFENCNIVRLRMPEQLAFIGERAFAGNKDLWTVLIPNVETIIEEDAFAGCSGQFLLCHGENPDGKENLIEKYARENGMDFMEIILSKEPIVNYHQEVLELKPEVRNFFYGDDGDEEKGQWCTWELDENAPNFGYDDWQWMGCSSWCACIDFVQEAEASSELASTDGRYCADNVLRQNRQGAWSEGVEGAGIGESLTYRQSCTYSTDNKWQNITWEKREPEIDGFMHYSEICIVNGYAKDQKTWEENGRIKRLVMYINDKPYAYLELEDTILPQYFILPKDDIKVPNGGMLEVRFEIAEVYPGNLYEDTCLTGLIMEFTGRYSH